MTVYFLWTLSAFCVGFLTNSFIEWAVHRYIMHKPNRIIPYGYLHTTSHHATFGADDTYHAIRPDMMEHGTSFTWREYILFPLLCTAIYGPIQLLSGVPIFAGAILSVVANLLLFDLLHYGFHVPAATWFQRTRFFRFLKDHHRIHHADHGCNFNVSFLPLADFCLGTLRTRL